MTEPNGPANERVPINIWGDVLTTGAPPIVRRVLTGVDAQECMYAWVYLNDLLSLREMARGQAPDALAVANASSDVYAAFAALRQATTDPQRQISDELIQTHAFAALAAIACGGDATEFCELGSTFFASIEKLMLMGRVLGRPLATQSMAFTGIERSPFMQRAASALFPDHQLRFVRDWRDWQPQRRWSHYLSRFVANYAFTDTATFGQFLQNFQVLNLTEVFNADAGDFVGWDLGLPITFLSLPTLIDTLTARGWRVYLIAIDPDFHVPRKQRCFVGRVFGIRGDAADRCRFFELVHAYPQLQSLLEQSEISAGDGNTVLQRACAAVSSERWEQIQSFKEISPIWGRVPERFDYATWAERALQSNGLNVRFEDRQIIAAVNAARAARR